MHFFDVVLTSTGATPMAAFPPNRAFDATVRTYDPANSAFVEALSDSAIANTGRQCVVCFRTTPKTIFSCRYKVHEKNQSMLSDYFKRSLDCGDLCDRCYRLWYKQRRAAKTKAAQVDPPQPHPRTHNKHHHHQQQIASRRCRAIHEKFLFEESAQMLETRHTGNANAWLTLNMSSTVFPSRPPAAENSHKLIEIAPPEEYSFDNLHNDQSSIATVEGADIVSNHDSADQFDRGDDDDDHVVVHIETLQRHKRRYEELEDDDDNNTPTEEDNSEEATICSRPLEQRFIEEVRTSSFEELLWLSRPPRKSRRKATPLRSVTRETTICVVSVSV